MLSFISDKDEENSHGSTKGYVREEWKVLMERMSVSRDKNQNHLEAIINSFFDIIVEKHTIYLSYTREILEKKKAIKKLIIADAILIFVYMCTTKTL